MQIFVETERLVLRRFTEADADNLFELDSDPEVMRFISGGAATPRDVIESDILPAFLRYYDRFAGYGFWAAIEKVTGEFVGWFHFRPPPGGAPWEAELGYRLRRQAWGNGYATEGARALIHKGFTDHNVQRVVASTLIVHTASRRVMEKVGLELVRTFCQAPPQPIFGTEAPTVVYALDRADWERRNANPSGSISHLECMAQLVGHDLVQGRHAAGCPGRVGGHLAQ